MSQTEAYEKFSEWYNQCLESGIDPSEVISAMGDMALITNPELIERLEKEGEI